MMKLLLLLVELVVLLLLLQPHIHLKKEIKHEEFKSTNKIAFKVER